MEKPASEKSDESVEKNLSSEYIPQSKLSNLPAGAAPGSPGISKEAQKQMDKIKNDVEKFKKDILKQFKYIEAIGLVPAPAAPKIEEEYEISEADAKRGLIHILTIIPEDNFKELGKVRLEAIKLAKEINEKLWVHVMTPIDLWNLGLDSKFEVIEALAMSYPIMDKGILGAIRVAEVHKSMVLRKFEKYVTSYVIAGSLVRGETIKTSDVDVFIIIDDTDVKRMSRLELKEKLRSIIYSYIQEAEAISGVKNKLSTQIYLLTEFWDAVKDAHPLFFTFIRDGVPLYDRGAFLPWKSLLKMGKIKPSPEAIDMFMSSGDKMEEIVKRRLMDIVMMDIYWGVITPTQGLLMLFGRSPGNVYDTVKEVKEILVEKEKILEKKYADIFEEICIKYYKGYEHGKIKEVPGVDVDRLAKNAQDYIKRLKELRKQIEKRVEEKTIDQVYHDIFTMLEAILKKKGEATVLRAFETDFVKQGKFPHRFLESLHFIAKVKREMSQKPAGDKKDGKGEKGKDGKGKDEKEKVTARETSNVEQARRLSMEITNALIEHMQRCDLVSMERSKFVLQAKDKRIEVFFLGNVFTVEGNKISKLQNGKLIASNTEELRNQLGQQQGKPTKMDHSALVDLGKIFGKFDLGC